MEDLNNLAPVDVGAKGTIVSLMAMELQLRSSYKPPQIHQPPIRNEAVSLYCLSSSRSLKNTSLDNSCSLKTRGSKEDPSASPGTFERRKRAVYRNFSLESDRARRTPSRKLQLVHRERAGDDLIPILSLREQQKAQKLQSCPSASPGKLHVKIVDTRCYGGGLELFRQASGSPSKFSFWKL